MAVCYLHSSNVTVRADEPPGIGEGLLFRRAPPHNVAELALVDFYVATTQYV
jgi:hypothetical protein